jgi:hypothetical protein
MLAVSIERSGPRRRRRRRGAVVVLDLLERDDVGWARFVHDALRQPDELARGVRGSRFSTL